MCWDGLGDGIGLTVSGIEAMSLEGFVLWFMFSWKFSWKFSLLGAEGVCFNNAFKSCMAHVGAVSGVPSHMCRLSEMGVLGSYAHCMHHPTLWPLGHDTKSNLTVTLKYDSSPRQVSHKMIPNQIWHTLSIFAKLTLVSLEPISVIIAQPFSFVVYIKTPKLLR